MANTLDNSCEALNMPFNRLRLDEIKNEAVYIYDNTTYSPRDRDYTEVVPGIFVEEKLAADLNSDYFNTPITGKDVYVGLLMYGGRLPTVRIAKYVVVDQGSLPTGTEWKYKKVCFDGETTIADLYRNADAYQYNADVDAYLKLPLKGAMQNKLKMVMQKRIMEIGGDSYDRIADLSRIILFLLTKVDLADDENELLAPLIARAHTAIELADVFHRERLIQDYVAEVKNDPEAYINANAATIVDTNTDEPEL